MVSSHDKVAENLAQTYTLNIVDMSGKQVSSQKIQSNTVNAIDVSALANAVYYVTIRHQSGAIIHKQAIITQ